MQQTDNFWRKRWLNSDKLSKGRFNSSHEWGFLFMENSQTSYGTLHSRLLSFSFHENIFQPCLQFLQESSYTLCLSHALQTTIALLPPCRYVHTPWPYMRSKWFFYVQYLWKMFFPIILRTASGWCYRYDRRAKFTRLRFSRHKPPWATK